MFKGAEVDVSGRIDRLVVRPDHVTLIDFKTGRPPDNPADVPQGVAEQLGVYRQLLANLYKGRTISAVVVWTQLGRAVPVQGSD
jgi:ATP-dependent helicase/nuclease subunit A